MRRFNLYRAGGVVNHLAMADDFTAIESERKAAQARRSHARRVSRTA